MALSPIDKNTIVVSGHLIERVIHADGGRAYWIWTPDGRPLCAVGDVSAATRIVEERTK